MRLSADPRGLWLLCALLSTACTFCAAAVNDTVLPTSQPPADISTGINVTDTSEVTTAHTPTEVSNGTTTPPHINVTTPSSNGTTSSNGTATTKASSTQSAAPPQPTKPVTTNGTSPLASTTVPNNTPGSSGQSKNSKFDGGSFVGGIVLTLAILILLYLGCKFYASKRGVQYRTIDEHEAII